MDRYVKRGQINVYQRVPGPKIGSTIATVLFFLFLLGSCS